VTRVHDPEGTHLAALHRLADLRGQGVIELGCGDGRLTVPVAADATFDPDADAIERARRSLPVHLAERVAYRVASGKAIEVEAGSFDVAATART
jgi:ubiquinone/menaquinone biosynthesis C-methylase UbiE